MFGADTAALRLLASKLEQLATRLAAIEASTSSKVSTMNWKGPDANRFRGEWSGHAATSMRSAAGSLSDAAVAIRGDATAQDRVSGNA